MLYINRTYYTQTSHIYMCVTVGRIFFRHEIGQPTKPRRFCPLGRRNTLPSRDAPAEAGDQNKHTLDNNKEATVFYNTWVNCFGLWKLV